MTDSPESAQVDEQAETPEATLQAAIELAETAGLFVSFHPEPLDAEAKDPDGHTNTGDAGEVD